MTDTRIDFWRETHRGFLRNSNHCFGYDVVGDSKPNVTNGDHRCQLPAPATFVIDRAGVVRWTWVDSNWNCRPEPPDMLATLRALKA